MARAGLILIIFACGFLCGSVYEQRAEAQLNDALKQAGVAAAAGALGPVGEMGTTLVDMEQHVSGLQKNLDALKKVKAALGGTTAP
jgi:hypothetical protein